MIDCLFIGHNDGAVARVAKTRALSTYNSGPAGGLMGARLLGVHGTIEREGEVIHVTAGHLVDLSDLLGDLQSASRDFH